jgi:hypothetical protein
MRAKKRSNIQTAVVVLAIANHAAMGVALGLVFALVLTLTPFFGVLPLINHSDDPGATMATFVGTVVLMFGVGAALTGLILMMEDTDA